ncbi:50S ribosomal protein L21 [Hoeflea prorocentri]|uniref:Large ribosomal subunit protein bL21 n=1 Tax=Hoeflea prorocentri TaxID=1922333 RepID=A0A9X3UQE5_9HYPH|nr:50S ribosomal protein L21 [Hoeflea prorocentri]MCY6383464.1 50S ribosomal protein L21 [Hoeflea prorocentri]MDA5401264.1 50S ribosomal protein L21 [Hoeflea prorocentri]
MFAVIKTGGKQYTVAADDLLKVEKLAGDAGDMVEFTEVLMVGEGADATIGKPFVDGALVTAEVVEQGRARKVIAFKKRRRQNSKRTRGHRQHETTIRISEILTGGAKPKKKAAAPKKAEAKKTEEAPKAKAPAKAKPAEEAKSAEKPKAAPKAKAAKEEPATIFSAPKGDADDLKKISGVGPVLEKKLHAFGVTQYAQIAAFSKDDIAKLDEALNFKGRIERDDWIGQAKALAGEAK